VIFDCDGVLIDSEAIGCRVEAEELQRVGFAITAEEIMTRFIGTTSAETFATIEAEHGRRLPAGFIDRLEVAIEAAFERELQPIAGIEAALGRITLPVCVASSSKLARLEHSLTLTGLLERFAPHVFSAEQVGDRGKPAPDLFLHAAARMAVAPASCLVIEDSVNGVRAAVAAGMPVLGFTGGSHCPPDHAERLLAVGAGQVLTDMAALPPLIAAPARPDP